MQEQTVGDCLERAIRECDDAALERRHENLMEAAVLELGLDRAQAERVYALAEEEHLDPVYAFELVRCRIGVRPLEAPVAESVGEAVDQAAPPWIASAPAFTSDDDPAELAVERRLRLSFRRLRAHLETSADAVSAARAFAAEPDVGPLRLI